MQIPLDQMIKGYFFASFGRNGFPSRGLSNSYGELSNGSGGLSSNFGTLSNGYEVLSNSYGVCVAVPKC